MDSTQKTNAEEIDIVSFLKPVGGLLQNIVQFFARQLNKIYKNIFLFLSIVLIAFLAGFCLQFFLPKQYQTKATLITHELPAEVCTLELSSLNQLIQNSENHTVLAQKLRIGKDAAGNILSISSTVTPDIFFEKEEGITDTANRLFQVVLRLSNPELIDTVQSGIIHFLENNDYSVKRKEAKRASLNSLRANLLLKVQSLDSLKSIVNGSIVPRSSGQGIILGQPIDPVSIYNAEISYYKEQLKIDQKLATMENIEIVQPFLKINAPNYPKYDEVALYFLAGGIVLAFMIISLRKKK